MKQAWQAGLWRSGVMSVRLLSVGADCVVVLLLLVMVAQQCQGEGLWQGWVAAQPAGSCLGTAAAAAAVYLHYCRAPVLQRCLTAQRCWAREASWGGCEGRQLMGGEEELRRWRQESQGALHRQS
jgi:hypothetical protein